MARLTPRSMIVAALVGGAVVAVAGTQLMAQDTRIGAGITVSGATTHVVAWPSTTSDLSTIDLSTIDLSTIDLPTADIPIVASTTSTSSLPATTPPTTSAPTPTDRGHDALELVDYDWQAKLPGWSVVFAPGREHVLGLTYVDTKTIEIYVRDNQTLGLLAHVIAHEMGHAVDVTLNDSDERQRWQEARTIGSAPWWPGDGTTDFSTGAGDFAESFAAWQVGSGNFRSKLAGPPSAEQLGLLAELSEG